MKNIIAILFVLFFSASINAQSSKNAEFQDECGDPSTESMIWSVISGKVIKVLDNDSIIIKQANGKQKTIILIAIDSILNETAAKDFFTKSLLKKRVEIRVNLGKSSNDKVSGVVYLDEKDVNRLMIKQGISSFKKPALYSLSSYSTCVYQKVEEMAKQNKLGIWAK